MRKHIRKIANIVRPFYHWLLYSRQDRELSKAMLHCAVSERHHEYAFAASKVISYWLNVRNSQKGFSVLDVGCASSYLSPILSHLGMSVCGIDCVEWPYTHENFVFNRGSLARMPYADESFDCVVAVSTIEHVGRGWYGDSRDETDLQVRDEMNRVLRPGGLVVVTVPYWRENRVQKNLQTYDCSGLRLLMELWKIQDFQVFIPEERNRLVFYFRGTLKEALQYVPRLNSNGPWPTMCINAIKP